MKFYKSTRIYTEEGIVDGFLDVKDGKFKSIITGMIDKPYEDFGDKRIIPGVIDTHNHGAIGYRFDECKTQEEIKACLLGEAAYGVTGIFPTINQIDQLTILADVADSEVIGSKILGIHSEGPWGARVGEKGDTKNTYYKPVNLDDAKRMFEDARGWLKLVAIAPEVDKALDAIRYFKSVGVTTSAYHTNANYAQANIGIDNGISVATHLGNVMTGLHHRDVGTMGACILRDEVTCELICDGLLVSLPMLKLIFKMKSHDKIMMISDNGSFLGAPVGHYKGSPSNANNDRRTIFVTEDGFVASESGRLSGSSRSVVFHMRNLIDKLDMKLEDLIKMSSLVPAKKYNLKDRGSIAIKNFADFVVIDDEYEVVTTFVEGRKVFDKETTKININPEFLKSKLD
ncbi:MAG: amidohydrolase family protein [Erysipelotrichaceae bacterium]|nr:amidohydrolase family protein [Erysipelotrichaceae bacterium]